MIKKNYNVFLAVFFGFINTFPHLTYKASLPANTITYTIILRSPYRIKSTAQDVPLPWFSG